MEDEVRRQIIEDMLQEHVRKKILYVDDVNHSLISVKNRLKKRYEVYPAPNANVMFEILERIMPDLILLDIVMPGMSGYEAIKKLKADSRYAGIPVIFLTSKSDRESTKKGFSLGAADYVPKPFSDPDLIERIERQINPNTRGEVQLEEEAKRKTIIYVDDVNLSLVSVRSRLKVRYEVYPAISVAKLFEILEKVTPDLILLDVNMPHVNGYEAIKQLKSHENYKSIPVIFLTSKTDQRSIDKGFSLGAADYVAKPFADSDLIERIERQINPETRRESWQAESIRKTIIHVDDINFNLVSVKARLKDHYEFYPALSVGMMFETLKHVIPDLILLDVNMPQVDGYEAIKRLKADARYSEIPVIFLTGKSNKDDMIKSFSLGAADYVAKPFTDAELIKRIEYQVNPQTREYSLDDDDGEDGKLRILAVDESFSMLSAVQHALSDDYTGPLRGLMQKNFALYYALRDDYKVFMLSKPEDVKDFLKQKTVDMFLLDNRMLMSDGVNLIQMIRESPEHKTTPIIIITSAESAGNVSIIGQTGSCDTIARPFEPEDLRAVVVKHIIRQKG
ncbi:MAG: response regulator [Chitinispirillales bacterium]|jgi:PleD family two-component response regulator|nr:response regulator [Chitinispirillales bacterium]